MLHQPSQIINNQFRQITSRYPSTQTPSLYIICICIYYLYHIIFKNLPSTYLPHREEIERLSAAELGKAAKVSLAEGDLTEDRWTRYSARASQLVAEVNFPEAARGVSNGWLVVGWFGCWLLKMWYLIDTWWYFS